MAISRQLGRAPVAPQADWRIAALQGLTLSGADAELAADLINGQVIHAATRAAALRERRLQAQEYVDALIAWPEACGWPKLR